jgi:voltage-gated potassium channel
VAYIVIEKREDIVHYLQTKGHDVLNGDATRTETLIQANLEDAQALIAASDSDSENTLVAVTAKEYRDKSQADFRIVVRVEDEENVEKVQHIGVDEVISPSTMAGRLMASRAVNAQE